ncbi:TRAP transporter small permease subunit [uncultured Boseongicola sp.]|jgi:TRAP-type C4-dicarboxylate transport system permease small subunit|uniref:TRAP transporter small permease n=1 Tax=uncultured Boseongicola sp. TaxID=1648499 RepID=UPI002614DB1B|nr:TRAP transporter small permease subunit [uncultured Boseongicola sp.]
MSIQSIQTIVVKACRAGVGLAFCVLIGAVLYQVIGRSIGMSSVWTEELTRYALLYLAAFGVGLSLLSGDLVNVDVICESLPGEWPRRLRLFSATVTAFLCLILLGPAWKYTSIGVLQTSAAMGLRMDFVHVSILVLLVLLLVFSGLRVVSMLWAGTSGLPEKYGDDA